MKKINTLLLLLLTTLLWSCSGSDTYQGKWKCMNADEEKFELYFSEDNVKLINHSDTVLESEYGQYKYSYKNGIVTYGISGENIGTWYLYFPFEDDKNRGLILDAQENIICSISKEDYLKIEQLID